MKRGEIYYCKLPSKNGSEQTGVRPVIIVSNDVCNNVSPIVNVVPITTKCKKWLPTHVRIFVQKDSIALCEQVTTISKSQILGRCGRVTKQDQYNIDAGIAVALGLKG